MTWPTDLKVTMIVATVFDGLSLVLNILGLIGVLALLFSAENFGLMLFMTIIIVANIAVLAIRFIVFVSSLTKEFSAEANKRCRNVRLLSTAYFLLVLLILTIITGAIPANSWGTLFEVGITGLIYFFSNNADKKNGAYSSA